MKIVDAQGVLPHLPVVFRVAAAVPPAGLQATSKSSSLYLGAQWCLINFSFFFKGHPIWIFEECTALLFW